MGGEELLSTFRSVSVLIPKLKQTLGWTKWQHPLQIRVVSLTFLEIGLQWRKGPHHQLHHCLFMYILLNHYIISFFCQFLGVFKRFSSSPLPGKKNRWYVWDTWLNITTFPGNRDKEDQRASSLESDCKKFCRIFFKTAREIKILGHFHLRLSTDQWWQYRERRYVVNGHCKKRQYNRLIIDNN